MPVKYPSLNSANINGKRVIVRAGFDVPVEEGNVTDDERIRAMFPTMQHVLDAGGSLVLLSHQGRPKGKVDPEFSQRPLVPILDALLKKKVTFVDSCVGEAARKACKALKPGDVVLLENLRFHEGEEDNDKDFAKELASLGDIYVNDAFPNCHRKHASMVAITSFLPSYMGLQLEREVEHLRIVLEDPRRPTTLIVSGAKMETKIPVIEFFLDRGDDILLGGAIANTFVAARGFDVGKSLFEKNFIERAQELMLESEKEGSAKIHIPRDAVVAGEASEKAAKLDLPLEDIVGDMAIYDIGKVTIERYVSIIRKSGMVVWNGPLGMYEYNRFSHASKRIAEAITEATELGAVSIIGGGDTLDFHKKYQYPLTAYTFVSTGGGAMLEFVSGRPLPALTALAKQA